MKPFHIVNRAKMQALTDIVEIREVTNIKEVA